MADRYEVFESSVVTLEDQEAVRFDPGEVTPKNKAEEAALEYLAGTEPPMAKKLRRTGGGN